MCCVWSILRHCVQFFSSGLCVLSVQGLYTYPQNIIQMECVLSVQHFQTWCPIYYDESSVYWVCRVFRYISSNYFPDEMCVVCAVFWDIVSNLIYQSIVCWMCRVLCTCPQNDFWMKCVLSLQSFETWYHFFFIRALCVECAGFYTYPQNVFHMKCVLSVRYFQALCPIPFD